MKKFSFRHKVFLVLLLLMNGMFCVTGYMAKDLTEQVLLRAKENYLLSYARILDAHLGPGGYAALLREEGVENASREEKIRALNRRLAPGTDEVGLSSSGLGIGYYSRELDAILTYGPSAQFGNTVGVSIAPDHPGREVMRTNMPLVRFGTMVRGNIMNAMLPVERGGEVIGYIWANELTTDITAQLSAMSLNLFLIMLACFGMTLGMLILLARRTVRNMDCIITGVRAMRQDLSRRIEGTVGELGDVADNINAMAEDVAKANAESLRAVHVLQSVLSNVEAVVYVCDPTSKKLVYANDTLCRLLNRGTMQDELCHETLHGFSEPCPFCPQGDLAATAPLRREMRYPAIQRDFLLVDRMITWHDGRRLFMEVGTDITERNALAVAEAANLAQRDFLARMSHEIRTPMNGVLGMTHLAMRADPPPAQMEYLKKIQASASLLLGIINDILDFSRIEAGKLAIEKHTFNLREMVDNVRELILPRIAEHDLEFSLILDESVPQYAHGDELRLSQILLNLLGNASKFTLRGSIRLLMSARMSAEGRLRLACSIADTGIGMSQKEQESLFKPFSQADSSTSRKFGGTGLGLSICKALVELMGGDISVSSEPGKGSVFSFFVDLDAVDAAPEEREPAGQATPGADVRYDGRGFLLVEDNAINQEIALAVLAELGAVADVAGNGEEGVAAFLAKDYDLILMDVRMPVMDGLEATRRIRASAKHDAAAVPIIAMTANAMQEDKDACIAAGMNSHIAKPIDLAELKSALFRHLYASGAPE
jgi:signal transduction histidine kinase/CheY-like chemotaxis protein